MNEKERLEKEKLFLQESLSSGVITQEEYHKANKRIEHELENLPKETFTLQDLNKKAESNKKQPAKFRVGKGWYILTLALLLLLWWQFLPEDIPNPQTSPLPVTLAQHPSCLLCDGFNTILQSKFVLDITTEQRTDLPYYPQYLFPTKEGLGNFAEALEATENGYRLQKEALPAVYFPTRQEQTSLAVFIAPFSSSTPATLNELQTLSIPYTIHFVGKDMQPLAGAATLNLEQELACMNTTELLCVLSDGNTIADCGEPCQTPKEQLLQDYTASLALGITVSPSYVINNQYRLSGFLPAKQLEVHYCTVNDCP